MNNAILILIIITTGLISFTAFNNGEAFHKLKFNPYLVSSNREWYRFISHGFVHGDWIHLIFNVYVLWEFGKLVMLIFSYKLENLANLYFLGLYFPAIIASSIFSYLRYKDQPHYSAVGASGAVMAVVFSSIILFPEGRMGLLFIPVMLPSWVFGLLYMVYTVVMARKQMDNIGHDAHFWGAVYGIIYTFALIPNSLEEFYHYFF